METVLNMEATTNSITTMTRTSGATSTTVDTAPPPLTPAMAADGTMSDEDYARMLQAQWNGEEVVVVPPPAAALPPPPSSSSNDNSTKQLFELCEDRLTMNQSDSMNLILVAYSKKEAPTPSAEG